MMTIFYRPSDNDPKFILDFQELIEDFECFCAMSNEEFLASLPDALHFACIAAWVNHLGQEALCDTGIIHQLIHLLTVTGEPFIKLDTIRAQFARELKIIECPVLGIRE